MNPQQAVEDVFLNDNDAAQIRDRIPNRQHLAQTPSRDTELMFSLSSEAVMVPPWTPFILVPDDSESLADAPLRILL